MRYLNIKTQTLAFDFIDDETTILSTDPRVSLHFQEVDLIRFERCVDDAGFPFVEEYELDSDGRRYGVYKEDKVAGVYVPDFDAMTKQRVPLEISRAQGKFALVKFGYWPSVLEYVDALPDDFKIVAQIALHDTLTWKRSSQFLNQMSDELEISTEIMDEMFIFADGVEL